MFEIIGLLFATGLLFALAAGAGLVLAFLVWLLVRRRNLPRKSLLAIAFLLPIASAAHLWLCKALLPGQTLFGDISQPMPDFANVSRPGSYGYSGFTQNVGLVAVDGPLVAGRYSHPSGSFYPDPDEPYFIFDTRTGQNAELPTFLALEQRLGHTVYLSQIESFHSQEPSYLLQQRHEHLIMFAPPILALTVFLLAVTTWAYLTAPISVPLPF